MSFLKIVVVLICAIAGISRAVAATNVVAFGLSDELHVFDSEARIGAATLSKYYAPNSRPIILTNTPQHAHATRATMEKAIRDAGKTMDKENDLFILFVTSHGNENGISLTYGGESTELGILDLRLLLSLADVRNKVLIVSSCFSGQFIKLADPHTLVITASDANHSSFGCTNTAKLTYFGELLFHEAIPKTASLREAFQLLKRETRILENGMCADKTIHMCDHSNPQIAGGQAISDKIMAIDR